MKTRSFYPLVRQHVFWLFAFEGCTDFWKNDLIIDKSSTFEMEWRLHRKCEVLHCGCWCILVRFVFFMHMC